MISEALLNKLLFLYNKLNSQQNQSLDLLGAPGSQVSDLLANRPVSFLIEGFETDEWKDAYIRGTEIGGGQLIEKIAVHESD